MSEIRIRSAKEADMPQVCAINTHYILNTALTFAQTPPAQESYHARLAALSARGLPYFVAVAENPTQDSTKSGELVVGYAYLSPFREHLAAYAPTTELSLFLHPDYYSQGIGSRLLEVVLAFLRTGQIRHMTDEPIPPHLNGSPSSTQGVTVENIIAVMAVDPEGKDKGEALRRWYIKRGFQESGRLSKVGFKHGHWLVSTLNF